MKWPLVVVLAGLLVSTSAYAGCEITAWKFGMSPEQVAAVTECGPYKSFKNGDLETYKGVFAGKEENFQFFFKDQRLWRIGVYVYEGQDSAKGADEWLALYDDLLGIFGAVETPMNAAPQTDAQRLAFKAKAIELVAGTGKIQMAPVRQAKDVFAFASYRRAEVEGQQYFYVTLFLDGR